jgi:hypothetical protein
MAGECGASGSTSTSTSASTGGWWVWCGVVWEGKTGRYLKSVAWPVSLSSNVLLRVRDHGRRAGSRGVLVVGTWEEVEDESMTDSMRTRRRNKKGSISRSIHRQPKVNQAQADWMRQQMDVSVRGAGLGRRNSPVPSDKKTGRSPVLVWSGLAVAGQRRAAQGRKDPRQDRPQVTRGSRTGQFQAGEACIGTCMMNHLRKAEG